jgi:hypothetical protein
VPTREEAARIAGKWLQRIFFFCCHLPKKMASRSLSPLGRAIGEEVERLVGIETHSREEIAVQRHTSGFGSPQPEGLGEAISQLHATQQLTHEQLKEFWGQHQNLRQATDTAFEESTSHQEQLYQELLKQKEEMTAHSRQLELGDAADPGAT